MGTGGKGEAPEVVQRRELERKLVLRLLGMLLAWTAVFGVAFVVAESSAIPAIADKVASLTASWDYYDEDAFNQLVSNGELAFMYAHPDIWSTEDGLFAVRDLEIYNVISAFKLPVVLALYLIGCVLVAILTLRRSVRYSEQLLAAARRLPDEDFQLDSLPPELAVAQNELAAIRRRIEAHDHAARAAEQRKNDLVAYLAHDIKTPLTSVTGYLSLLSEAPDIPEESRRRYTATALDKAYRLESLIDEFFEITRYNLHTIPVEREVVDVALLCGQIGDEFYPEMQAKNLGFSLDVPEGLAAFLDPGKIARVLANIVRNAVAYAREGSTIAVRARVEEGGTLVLSVANEGREISEAHLQRIFERFFREDDARGSSKGGAGLGLAIAKEIATAHGGTIDAESAGGKTVFTVSLPSAAVAAQAAQAAG